MRAAYEGEAPAKSCDQRRVRKIEAEKSLWKAIIRIIDLNVLAEVVDVANVEFSRIRKFHGGYVVICAEQVETRVATGWNLLTL